MRRGEQSCHTGGGGREGEVTLGEGGGRGKSHWGREGEVTLGEGGEVTLGEDTLGEGERGGSHFLLLFPLYDHDAPGGPAPEAEHSLPADLWIILPYPFRWENSA